jgi:hypothetical protein
MLLLVLSVASIAAHAQENDPDRGRFYLGIGPTIVIPSGEFAKNIPNAGFGLTAMFGYSIGSMPVMLGLEGGFAIYGSKERREPFSSTIPDVTVKVQTTNSIGFGHLLLRLQPQEGIVRPYVDGLVGANYLSTTTSVNNEGNGEAEVASSTNQDDLVLSYGAGGGVMIRVYHEDYRKNDDSQKSDGPAEVFIDLRGRYMWGNVADYLTEDSITRNGSNVQYDVKRSKTDLATVYLGVTVRF